MKTLNVVHICESLGGGVYSYFCDLTKSFGEDSSVQTTIIYSDKRSEIIPANVSKDFHKNIKLIRLDMQEKIDPIRDWSTTTKLKTILKCIKPDVIHLHSSKAGVLGKIASKRSGLKAQIYYTPHGYSFLRKDIPNYKKYLFYAIEKFMASYNNCTTIACGDTERLYALRLHSKVRLVRNGIDYEWLSKFKKAHTNDSLTVGILGRITNARNPEFFNQIALNFPEIKFKWIGDGVLNHQITSKNIEITGWFMKRKDGLKVLNELDIYLQTSLWEGLPIAVLEAMALGKPVVATKVIGNRDIIEEGKTGYLIDSLEQAVEAIQKLKSKKLRDEFGKHGRMRVQKHFNSLHNFKALIDIYKMDNLNQSTKN